MKTPLYMIHKPQNLPSELDFRLEPLENLEGRLAQADIWYLDTETYPKGWGYDDALAEYTETHKNVLKHNVDKYYDAQRAERALDPHRNSIRLIQIHIRDAVIILDTFQDDVIKILEMIPNKMVCGTNLKFDLMTIYSYLGKRVPPKQIYDVMVGNKIMYYQRQVQKHLVKNGYKDMVKKELGIDLNKENQQAEWDNELTSDMIFYAYSDVLYLPNLLKIQTDYINSKSVNKLVGRHTKEPYFKVVDDYITKLEMEFIKVVTDMELAGVPVNVAGLNKFKRDFQPELQKSYDALGGLNVNSPKQLIPYLESVGADVWITAKDKNGKEELKKSSNKSVLLRNIECPLVPEILTNRRYRKLETTIDTYAENPVAYSNFISMVGYTGRMASKDLPLQTVDRKIKDIFYENDNPDYVLIKADYPNIEARIASVIANDKMIKRIFKNDEDMHLETAKFVMGTNKVSKEERQKAKAVNFGFIYGAGAKTFQAYAFDSWGLVISIEEAQEYRRKFLEMYEGIHNYHLLNGQRCAEDGVFIVKTLLGRRMIVKKFTDSNNFPVQGTGADFIKMAALNIWLKLDPNQAEIVNMIHDEIVIKTKKSYIDTASKILKSGMETAVNSVIKDFTTSVDVDIID